MEAGRPRPDELFQSNRGMASLRSVGTRGGCGEGWGPCACPHGIMILLRCDEMRREVREPGEACRHEDKHQTPASSPLIPLSLQDGDAPPSLTHSVGKVHQDDEEDYPIRLEQFIRTGAKGFPSLG